MYLPGEVHKFFDPVINWVKNLKIETFKVDLKLEYLNTSSTKKILNLLVALDENVNIQDVTVNWYYEFDDLETEIIGSLYHVDSTRPIANFHAHAVSVFPEQQNKNEPLNLWETDSTAIARQRFESLVYSCFLELLEQDERSEPNAPPGWKPVGPAKRVKWPPVAGLSNH